MPVISSPAFENEDWIPNENSGFGADISPELHIESIPDGTETLLITMDDLGHPIRPGFNHWVAWNLPPISSIPKHLPKAAVAQEPIHIEQGMAYGKHCYRGPKPPFNWNHRYVFTVYALDCRLSLNAGADKADALRAAQGHILDKGELFGKYQRKHSK